MTKERKKSPLPVSFGLPDPLEPLEKFDSMISELDTTIKGIDGRIGQMDRKVSEIDKRFTLPPLPKTVTPKAGKPHSHLSYEGQSELDYCIECIVNNHGPKTKTLMREAVQRARAGSPSDLGVIEKVRGVVDELAGIEEDSDTVKNEKIGALNSSARAIRKLIYAKRADVGGASLEDLLEIKDMIDKLLDAAYQVRAEEGPCIGCTIEELCGADLECVEFVEKAAAGINDPEEFQRIIKEAREKYRRG